MKVIINRKIYDTDKSRLLYTDRLTNRRYYQSPKGTFFVVYANGTGALKSDEDIMELLAEVNVPLFIELFGEPEEG